MSDLQDLIHRNGVISYDCGRRDERTAILRLAEEASTENHIGKLVYLDDLRDYIEDYDRKQNERKSKQAN